jgi:hypothetical protein
MEELNISMEVILPCGEQLCLTTCMLSRLLEKGDGVEHQRTVGTKPSMTSSNDQDYKFAALYMQSPGSHKKR